MNYDALIVMDKLRKNFIFVLKNFFLKITIFLLLL
jgi:hypothetical protein